MAPLIRPLCGCLLGMFLAGGSVFPVAHGEPLPVRFLVQEAPTAKTQPALPLSRLRVFDPYEQQSIEFEGYDLPLVLDRVYGPGWRKLGDTHQLRMKCLDGYRLSVPLSRILGHRALLAIRRMDSDPAGKGGDFTILKKDVTPPKRVNLQPAYLVWENELDRAIRAEGDYGWPFQWAEASLERLGEGDPLPRPPDGASSAAFRGYSHFQVHCLKCHSIGGVGGKVGPELHHPRNVTRYWRPGLVEAWILNPASFRMPNGMPPLAPAHPDRKKMAHEIVSYLSSLPPSRENP